ncbi:ribonuclease H-like domain-containing protein [Cladochytrium replicatum]|nr:ribonuclease H-like domain-containing protein [Cladochytrium replicatum]
MMAVEVVGSDLVEVEAGAASFEVIHSALVASAVLSVLSARSEPAVDETDVPALAFTTRIHVMLAQLKPYLRSVRAATSSRAARAELLARNRRYIPENASVHPLRLFDQCRSPLGGPRFMRGQSLLIFTDGCCINNGKADRETRAGFAFVFRPNDGNVSAPLEIYENLRPTNNRAELRAVIAALEYREWPGEGAEEVVIASDSEYVVAGISERIHNWIARDWRTANRMPVANQDLWEKLLARVQYFEKGNIPVKFWLIPREWNTMADRLAKAGAEEEPPVGYMRLLGVPE